MAALDFSIGLVMENGPGWGLRRAKPREREDILIEGRAYLNSPYTVEEIQVWTGFNSKTLTNEFEQREGPFAEFLIRLIEESYLDEMARKWRLDGELQDADRRRKEWV